MDVQTIGTREIINNYPKIFERIKKTKEPIVIYKQKTPQVAVISLDDLEKLMNIKSSNSVVNAIRFAKEAREILNDEDLPSDLSLKYDDRIT
ncbi:type II toxin-antitoxin system Phd/YefM family antitoxin [Patescibacteria group bacterium]|nr:type II toxin-antitoxin system Phd/YefM family antitoxin [Patescibacteria group bacterium]